MSRSEIIRELLVEGVDDWVLVDTLIALAREVGDSSSEGYKAVALEILESLIKQGLVQIGDIGETGFEVWSGTPGEVMDKVVRVLDACEWAPMGGAFWIANTALGDAKAISL